MSDPSFIGTHFINKAEALIVENLSNEQFGVSELADAMNMSRSNLLRKIKKQTQLSASQFIRQVRLQKGMELLKEASLTVSEISYQVGFGSTSYFIKCFREHYGHPPGEVGKGTLESEPTPIRFSKQYRWQIIAMASLVVLVISFFLFSEKHIVPEVKLEKSIAVLPFKNESSDSTNLYFVNGLMESALGNLQKIEDLRVISRTSVEKYRNTEKGITEIAEELNVNYLLEGSGQRIGNQVLLNIQLIEASTDRPIWVEQYSREVKDVFALQNEVARKITVAIEAMVTPAELEQIEKSPTESVLAYDYYLQALDPFHTDTKKGWEKAILLFEKAIEQDPQFALAYANIAISYYYLDIIQKQKQYKEQINNYADKALLYDSKSDISLIAKALYYMYNEEYRLALPHLKKALEYNPNSSAVVRLLSLLYANHVRDTGQALKYALMDVQLDIAAKDSIPKSYIYLNLSNAFIQNGFPEEALSYINKSVDLYPENPYAPWLKTMILFAKNGDIERTTSLLEKEWQKDTTRLDILQDVANFHYYQEDYDTAFFYFEKFSKAKEKYGLGIYPQSDLKIGLVYQKKGLDAQAAKFFNSYAAFCEKDQSIYKSMHLAMKYVSAGKNEQAIEQLNVFATQNNYWYWILIYQDINPLMKPLKNDPEFKEVIQKIEERFWKNQKQLRKSLEEKGLV
ncbi:helix-turn-helix domain-containing protein [Maribacter antarcticus]|uniref:helix-turn-helix domain-containing protein n=1 Tax=Maribacter antarcticus TaxID=505250 RepID=UPI000478E691|nr:helix-turn-helix domain-containing protein [Maribacter antarcticus]